MASKVQSQAPMSRLGRLVVPALEKVVKAASWRKHQRLITECKSVIDHFTKAPEKLPPLPSPSTFKREKVEQAADQPSERTGDAGVPPVTPRSAKENGSEEDSTIRGPGENLAGEGTTDVQAASSASEESQALSSTGASEIGAATASPEQEAGGEAGAGTGAESAAENGSAPEEHAEQNGSLEASLARSESAAAVEEAKPAVQSPDFTQQFSSGSGKESDFAWGIPARPILFDGDTPVSHGDAELILRPLQLACETSSVKIVEPALDLVQKLVAHGHLRGEVDIGTTPDTKLLQEVFDGVCRCYDIADETVELLVLRALLTGVTSQSVHVHGETLLKIVRTCYNIFLGSKAVVNQTTAKAALTQMLVLVFRRMEADTSQVAVTPIVVADLMEPAERSTTDQTSMLFVQGFINKVVQEIGEAWTAPVTQLSGSHRHDGAFDTIPQSSPVDEEGVKDAALLDAKSWEVNLQKEIAKKASQKGGLGQDVGDELEEGVSANTNSLRRDAFLVFRALCKLSMKAPPQEGVIDPFAVRGKIVALELLKILLENAGTIFRTNERFVGAIKQYLCLSLLKNSASSLLSVFQLSCSIFMSLVARFRAGLKAEIGVFFPMIVLRVLENVAQPNYAQKMIVMRFLEKLSVDPQILVDVFVNYDCDLDSSNIFERTVNGLLKTAQGVPPGVETTLEPKQDGALRLAAVKCLVGVLRSMGSWTNKQLNLIQIAAHGRAVAVSAAQEKEEGDHLGSDGGGDHLDGAGSEVSEAVHFEQRRAYKIELQEGIALFNKKPKKGIEFLVRNGKLGGTPEEIAAFLREGRGLDKVMVGEYLGERDDTCLKVMHAYVDAHDFAGIEFDNAIRLFLSGFRLPGEAQKIDRLMEKFAQRYCKCNPKSFSSADTAYVLAYSVIMLNTDAHNPMVKQKMSKAQFIRNNRGIDENGDLPEEFLGALYDRIVKNEIKMKSDGAAGARAAAVAAAKPQGGLEAILQLVLPRRKRDVSADTSEDIIRHMQDMFKQGTGKGGTLFNAASDVEIVRPMVEVVWAPMLAAFSVPLDKSDDAVVTYQCLEGFRHAIHVAAVMQMETIRDAYITSLAKFTSLHSAADIKQKNIDAIKTLMSVAEEDGNHLADAWEHVLTCISRFEHLHQIGEGVMTDAALFAGTRPDAKKARGSAKGSRRSHLPAEAIQSGAIKRGSYDSAGVGGNAAGPVTSEQIATLVSNLGLLEQIDSTEINRIFTSSERLNSEAIVEFVKAIIKVSLDELRSPAEPRIFSLTKIVEISHFNMSRIRLVWSRIWAELSDYFVTVGCAENLTVAMYAVDSLRQLAMKFLERDELANYNFQNDFLKPFVVIMRKSNSVEIRELIIRCMSQMVLARVGNVKSGWKVMFMVFTTAAADEHKNIVTLAFQTIEKIVRDYFSYITETETSTFTDCVNCLIAFTNSRFNKDVSLNAIAFLRFCALKLAEGELGQPVDQRDGGDGGEHKAEPPQAPFTDRDDHLYFWFPLLAGLSELTFDPRPDVRKSSLEVLFDTLRYHGHLFSPALWERVFDSVLFPIFDYVRRASAERSLSLASDRSTGGGPETPGASREGLEMDVWLYETCTLALQLVVDLFVKFYAVVDPLLPRILGLLTAFIKRPHQSLAAIGVAAFVRLISSAGALFSPADWDAVLAALADAGSSTLPDLSALTTDRLEEAALRQQRGEALDDDDVEESASTAARMPGEDGAGREGGAAGESGAGVSGAEAQGRGTGVQEAGVADEAEGHGAEEGAAIGSVQQSIADLRCRTAVQLLLVQAVSELYALHRGALSPAHTLALLDVLYLMAGHAHKVNSDPRGRARLQQLRALTQMADPPLLRLESEAFHAYLTLLQRLPADQPQLATPGGPLHVEARLVDLCAEVLHMYINTASAAGAGDGEGGKARPQHWAVPLGSARRRELTARSPLVVAALQAITALKGPAFEQHLTKTFFPLLTQLVGCEHSSADVQAALSTLFTQRVGPLLLGLKVGKI